MINSNQLDSQRIDAVLPLTLNDIDRFYILKRSLDIFCQNLFRKIWVVVPDSQFYQLKSKLNFPSYCVVPESSIIPEVKLFPVKGWYLQQLIKLAIAEYIDTEFYLTLDADVICTQPLQLSDLIIEGRGVYYAVDSSQYGNSVWYEWSRETLNLEPKSKFDCYNVTPTILNKYAVMQLQNYLNELSSKELREKSPFSLFRSPGNNSKRGLMATLTSWFLYKILPNGSSLRTNISSYRSYLIRHIPWTEYSLYYIFCEYKSILDRYHIRIPNCIYAGEESVWHGTQYSDWNPEDCFKGERDFFFCVFQSNTQISPDLIWERVKPFLREDSISKES